MSSVLIVKKPSPSKIKGEDIPDWVLEALVDVEVGLTSPQKVHSIGCAEVEKDIADMLKAFPVSLGSLMHALRQSEKENAAEWFGNAFPEFKNLPIFSKDIILIGEDFCKYKP